jgi:hypothetical protein
LAIIIAVTGCAGGESSPASTAPIVTPPSTFPPLPTTTMPSAPSLLIVGDFLTRDTEGLGLADAITSIGWTPTIDTSENRTIPEGADLIDLVASSGQLPRLTFVSLGATDACGGAGPIDVEADVRRVSAHADAEHVVVWVNLQMKDCMARARAINETLVRVAFENPHFHVADWATDAPSNLLAGDGIHYKRAGSEFRIDYYVSLVRMYSSL